MAVLALFVNLFSAKIQGLSLVGQLVHRMGTL